MSDQILYKILVVDDEEDICEILKYNLEAEGFHVDTCFSGAQALSKTLNNYHLFIFDIMMEGMSGFSLADQIRKKMALETPIIFLSAKNSENDKITGFSIGADDYITKPFSIRETIARVKAVLKRKKTENSSTSTTNNLKVGVFELNDEKKKLYINGSQCDLTPYEYHIILLLMQNKGKVLTREQILNHIWKDTEVLNRTIDVHITRLRKKMGEYGKMLINRPGHGYCLEIE